MTTRRGRTYRTLSRVTAAIDLLLLAARASEADSAERAAELTAAAERLVPVAGAMVAELERAGVVDLQGVRADLEVVRDGG